MKVFNKIKGWFVEEYEDDEEEEEVEQQEEVEEREQYARKVEVPKPSFRDRFKNKRIEEENEEEQEEVEVQEVEVPVQREQRVVNLVEEEEEPEMYEPTETKEEVPIQEEEEEFPARSTRVPLVFEDDNLFPEEEHEEENEEVEYEKPLYQGKKESTYVESMKNSSYLKTSSEPVKGTKFKPSPIISPIYGILDKNYKKEEIVTRKDKTSESEYRDSSIDKVRKKAFGDNKKDEKSEPVKEKKVNFNNSKPGVSSVTLADADEYYNDLGLAYNEDYKDMSRVNTNKKKEESKKKDKDDDNLFDLIDSMYKKED